MSYIYNSNLITAIDEEIGKKNCILRKDIRYKSLESKITNLTNELAKDLDGENRKKFKDLLNMQTRLNIAENKFLYGQGIIDCTLTYNYLKSGFFETDFDGIDFFDDL